MKASKVRRYSRSEMEALRNVDATEQRRKWNDAFRNLVPSVAEDYVRLEASGRRQYNNYGNEWQPVGSGKVFNLDRSSDESGQKPALFVDGEPDFESGPPLDGLEYRRHARCEAAQIPKVMVHNPQSSEISSEQTPYMPTIPEIPKCPSNLLPSKQWEDAFLAEFSELRQAISQLGESCGNQSAMNKSRKHHSTPRPKKNDPSVSSILSMDVLSRAAELRDSISKLDAATSLSRKDCLWLFSLCAAVDTPLCSETCASLRCLLRKCSGLLALKSEQDDEVAMLSVLVAITGKYFGQADRM